MRIISQGRVPRWGQQGACAMSEQGTCFVSFTLEPAVALGILLPCPFSPPVSFPLSTPTPAPEGQDTRQMLWFRSFGSQPECSWTHAQSFQARVHNQANKLIATCLPRCVLGVADLNPRPTKPMFALPRGMFFQLAAQSLLPIPSPGTVSRHRISHQ